MPRARGTYTTIENWALDLAPSLPGISGWVMLELCRQSNYTRKSLTAGQLLDKLPYEIRAIQNALKTLVELGHAHVDVRGAYKARTCEVRETCTDVRREVKVEAVQDSKEPEPIPAIQLHNKKESEGIQKEVKEKTKARQPTAPDSGTVTFPEVLYQLPDFPEAWARWMTYRRARRLTVLPMTLTAQLGFLAAQPQPAAVIDQAIEKGWQGLFPLKGAAPSTMPKANQLNDQDWAAEAAAADRHNRFQDAGGWN